MAGATRKPVSSLKDEHQAAKHAVESWLYGHCSEVTALSPDDVKGIRRGLVGGWRVPLEVMDGVRTVEILIPAAFPFRPPRVRVVDMPEDNPWPHAERDDVLCLVPETASFDPDDPVGGVANLLNMAIDLSRRVAAGEADAEFRAEVLSYWTHRIPADRPPIYSLAEPGSASKALRVWKGPASYVVADDSEALNGWLTHRYPGVDRIMQDVGALLWLDEALTPDQFPRTAEDVWNLARRVGAGGLLAAAASAVSGDLVVGLGMETDNGKAIAGLVIPRPARRRGRDMVHDGFRPGRTPHWLAAKRFFGVTPVLRSDLRRVDHSWVHGRDQDDRAADLRSRTAVIIGCGSVGAPVAIALAQAGVGRFILLDPDVLKPSNISRHPLGAQYLGRLKVEGLADKLTRDLPHITVRGYSDRLEEVLLSAPDVLLEADLIVCATGDWGAEVMLDAWQEANGRPTPVVYGWTEAHACAGHAVAIVAQGASFREGFDATGLPRLPVTDWPTATQLQEPACGAVYQPYGPIELQGTVTAVAELALDTLLSEVQTSTHRIWAGRQRLLSQAGGRWSTQWLQQSGNRTEGGCLVERPWAAPLDVRARAA